MRFKLSEHLSTFLEIEDYMSLFNYPGDFEAFFSDIYSPDIYSSDFKKSQHRLGIHASLSYAF